MLVVSRIILNNNFGHFCNPCKQSCRILSTSCCSSGKKKRHQHKKASSDKKGTEKAESSNKKAYTPPTKKYQHTILLPSTNFSLGVPNVKEYEQTIQKENDWATLYQRQRSQPERQKEFVLHDGPPYANGDLHIGHALNKIAKDITGRQKMIDGYKLHYIPGWDCHGLPIELIAQKNSLAAESGGGDAASAVQEPLEIRKMAREFSERCVEKQMAGFQRWGVLADWDNAYLTSQPRYVAQQLQIFDRLQQQGLVYRGLLPVYYSPSSRSTLAESELVYNEQHESQAVLLAVRVTAASAAALPSALQSILSSSKLKHLFLSVYTTTPWSLPVNRAICYHPDIQYCVVQVTRGGSSYALVWAKELLSKLNKVDADWKVLGNIDGSTLSGLQYQQPVTGAACPVLAGDHVTAAMGTGLVHTAPAHGREDFVVGQQHGLDLSCPVDDDGCFDGSVGPALAGLPVLGQGNTAVMALLESEQQEEGPRVLVLQHRQLLHSYPYDWRTKQPVIMRASKQWFIDTQALRDKAVSAVTELSLLPHRESAVKCLQLALDRPHWCISRQRAWGAPIPVFYDHHTGQPLTDRSIVPHVVSILEREGCDAWWRLTAEELLPPALLQQYRQKGCALPSKGSDILDIWLDSGCSWHVLDGRVADLIVEGEDQYRGWFQSLLLTSLADRSKAPYSRATKQRRP